MGIKSKTIEELKEDLEALETVLETGEKKKKRAKLELQRKKELMRHVKDKSEGLDVFTMDSSVDIKPGTVDSLDSLSDIKIDKRSLPQPDDPGTRIDKIKGIEDILEE